MYWRSSDVFFVTIWQRWAYKHRPTREMDASMIVWHFLCNNIARMCLQKHAKKWDVFDDRLIVVFATNYLFSPNEDFGRSSQYFRMRFRSTFQRLLAQITELTPLKSASKTHSEQCSMQLRNVRCGLKIGLNSRFSKFMLPKRWFWKAEQTMLCII